MAVTADEFLDLCAALRYARCLKTGVDKVYKICGSRWFWNAKKAEREKIYLLSVLREKHDYCFLWLDSRFEDFAKTLEQVGNRKEFPESNDWCGWFVYSENNFCNIFSKLGDGGWGILFFDAYSTPKLNPTSPLPAFSSSMKDFITELGADAGLISELDDMYWLCAFRN